MSDCSITGCPGHYERREITRTLRKEGQLVVIENVPAEVCDICGDTILAPDTVRALEAMLEQNEAPSASAPVYEYRATG
jgi:YgiT-type zinc finger domain-containing protein